MEGLGKQSVGHYHGAYMSLVLMPAPGFRDKVVVKGDLPTRQR